MLLERANGSCEAVPKSFEFQVSSFKFVGRASVPASVGCAPRTINRPHFFMVYRWAESP
jgi:hypothetical protein